MNEPDTSYRQIFTDGRPLPNDPNPSWNGYSSGKWEGDTARITERFHRPDFGHLDVDITVDDPKAYTKPFTITLHQAIKLDTDLLDEVCSENEKDASRLSSK